jgi:PEGA domain
MRKTLGSLALTIAALSLSTRPAAAQPSASDRATARALAEEGGEALDKKNYEIAADRFARADALVHAPTLSLELARAQVGLRRFVEAQESYLRIIREGVPPGSPPSFTKAFQDAQKEIKAIPPRLGWVTLTISGANAFIVTIDGNEVPKAALDVKRAVNPGNHIVKASADGFVANETTFAVGEGESAAVSLTLEPMPASATAKPPLPPAGKTTITTASGARVGADTGHVGSTQKTLGIVALGVGGAGLVAGSITGLMAISRHGDLQTSCSQGQCPPEQQHTLDSYRTISTVSTVGFIVGAAGAIGGTMLLLTAPSPREGRAQISPFIGLTTAGAQVTF